MAIQRTLLFLLHGVGLPREDQFGSKWEQRLQENLKPLGTSVDVIVERVDWHESVDLPLGEIGLNPQQVAGVTTGLIGSASRLRQSFTPTERLLEAVLLFCPVALFLLLVAEVNRLIGWGHDHRFPWVVAFAETLSRVLTALLPAMGGIAVSTILMAYGLLIVSLGMLHFIAVAIGNGFLTGIRVLAVSLMRPVVTAATAAVSVWGMAWIALSAASVIMSSLADSEASRFVPLVRHELHGDVPSVGLDTGYLIALTQLIMLVVLGGLFFILKTIFAAVLWPLKVCADVARFMGDRDYHRRLIEHVESLLLKHSIRSTDRLIIVAHSLGSAIALLWLLNRSNKWRDAAQVILVTMGSPISRMLSPFFPKLFPTADEASMILRARTSDFRWLNIYRPWDPIGAKLFRTEQAWKRDVSTGQWTKIGIAAHSNYWDDVFVENEVWNCVRQSKADSPTHPDVSEAGWDPMNEEAFWSAADRARKRHAIYFRRILVPLAMIVAIVMAVTKTVAIAAKIGSDPLSPASIRSSMEANRADVRECVAELFQYKEILPANRNNPVSDRIDYVAVFPLENGQKIGVKLGPLSVRWNMTHASTDRTAVMRAFDFIEASKSSVKIRYLSREPSIIDFPQFSPVTLLSAKGIFLAIVHGLGVFMGVMFTVLSFAVLLCLFAGLFDWSGAIVCGEAPNLSW